MTSTDMSAHGPRSGGASSGPPSGSDPVRADDPGLLAQVPAILYIADTGDEHAQTSAAEYRLRHRDGRTVWLRDDAQLVITADGSRRWHGVMSDISDRKQAEAELELRAAQQEPVARLGEHALEGASITELCQEVLSAAVRLLGVQIGAILELLPDRDALTFRAVHGISGVLAKRAIPADPSTQAGFTLQQAAPVVVEDWQRERCFARIALLADHGRAAA